MPIKENFKIEKEEKKVYPPLPENIYQVQLLDVNLDERPSYATRSLPPEQQELEKVFAFQFTLLVGKEGDKELRGRNVWDNFVKASLYASEKYGKCKLWQIIEACLGRALTQEEEMTFESDKVNKLIGMQLRIGTKHKKSGDKVWDNVESYYSIEARVPELNNEEKEEARVKVKKEDKSPQNGSEGAIKPVSEVEAGGQKATFDDNGKFVPEKSSVDQAKEDTAKAVEFSKDLQGHSEQAAEEMGRELPQNENIPF